MRAPSAENLLLGAGQLFFQRFDANGVAVGGMLHLGNVETLELTTTDDKLIKKSSMSRARPVYKSVTRSRDIVLRAVADEFNADNLALMLMGSVDYTTDTTDPVVDQILFADVPAATLGAALGGQYFHVGAFNIGTVSMKVGATALDTDDFEVVNAQMGLIYIKPTAPTTTNGTDDLKVSYTPEAITGTNAPIIVGGTETEIQGSVLYVSDNTSGENFILRVWNVSVTPDGAVGLISEEFGTFALNMTVQDDSNGAHGGSADDPLYHLQYVPEPA